ncbi:MAG TPA: diadenylate cyclase CdaA [Candidatus Cryosericum sp.]|jgi:diadenylate cyclase|nr:diadenylate cyclase CdaA [Candidatus Cryosericum sp.]
MGAFDKFLTELLDNLTPLRGFSIVVDIVLTSLLFYALLRLISNTRALQLAQGLAIYYILVYGIEWLSLKFGLLALNSVFSWLRNFSTSFLPLLLVMVFQPELRRMLGRLGSSKIVAADTRGQLSDMRDWEESVDEIVKSVKYLSMNRIGALICIQRQTGLEDYVETGVRLDALVRAETLSTLFYPNSALHDGGVIIADNRIVAARCLFPLTASAELERGLGTRHRAAIGITEETDCIVVVVSEQTGVISLAVRGKLTRYLSPLELRGMLLVMTKPAVNERRFTLSALFHRRKASPGKQGGQDDQA